MIKANSWPSSGFHFTKEIQSHINELILHKADFKLRLVKFLHGTCFQKVEKSQRKWEWIRCTLIAVKLIPCLSGFPVLQRGRIPVVFKEGVESVFSNSGFQRGVCSFQENEHKSADMYPLTVLLGCFCKNVHSFPWILRQVCRPD